MKTIPLIAAVVVLVGFTSLTTRQVQAQTPKAEISKLWKLSELPSQNGWKAFAGGSGTWPGVNGSGDYRIAIDPPLPSGRYRLQVRAFYAKPEMEISLGDRREKIELARNAFSNPLDIEIKQPASELILHSPVPSGENPNPLQAVFLTTDLREQMDKGDVIVRSKSIATAGVTEIPPPPARDGNYLENSSFEVGPGHGWGKFWNDQLDNTTAFDGKTSLRLPVVTRFVGSDVGWVYEIQKVETKLYRLPPGKYTVSGYFKADRATKPRGFFGIESHPNTPDELGIPRTSNQRIVANRPKSSPGMHLGVAPKIGTEWTRITQTVDVPADVPGDFWTLQFTAEWRVIERGFKFDSPIEEIRKTDFKDIPKYVWVDSFQIERADAATGYQARNGIEVGVRCDQPGHILYDTEPSQVQLLVYNPKKSAETLNVQVRVEDYQDVPVKQETLKIPLEGKTQLSKVIELPRDKRGIFRLLVTHDKDPESKEELVYSVLPPNKHLNDFYPEGHTGADNHLEPRGLAILKRANCNWVIHKHLGRMETAQPTLGTYRWFDEELQAAMDAKITVLGQVFVNDPPAYIEPYVPGGKGMKGKGTSPVWEPEKKQKYMEIWADYVTKLVSHYKGKINHWEVTNEPYFWATPEQYAEILKVASEAIRKVDPNIHIIGFCSANMRDYFPAAVRASDPSWYDGMSGHFYDADQKNLRFLASVALKQNKTAWQTEAGPTFPSFYVTLPTYQQLVGAEHHANPSSQTMRDTFTFNTLQNELRCYGSGRIDHYFHYITRFANAWPSEPTRRIGGGKEDVEYDGSLRPYAVGRSIAGHFLDGSKNFGEWRGDPRLTLALFAKDKGTVGFVWSNDGRPMNIAPKSFSGWQIFDWVGNPIPSQGSSFPVDRRPRYFIVAAAPAEVAKSLDEGTVFGQINVDARLQPAGDGKEMKLSLLVQNETDAPQAATLNFGGMLGGYVGNSSSVAALTLKPREQRLVTLPVSGGAANRTLVVNARVGDTDVNFPFNFAFARAIELKNAAGLTDAPVEPFNFDLVRSGNGNRMSPADFTPVFQAGYDSANLYLAANITDDLLSPSADKIVEGQNDQVHFQIAAAAPARQASKNPLEQFARVPSAWDYSIVLAPTGEKTLLAELRSGRGASEKLAATMTKTADGYRVTVAVPWTKVGMRSPKAGDSIVFNAVAFDADGMNRDHKTEWPFGGGPNFEYANPTGWGELSFGK